MCLWSCSRSTSAFGKNPLLSRRTWKACCPLQRCTALVVCSSLKEPMFMFRIMAQQENVWCPYSPMKVNHEEVWLDGSKCWRTGLWFASRLLPTLINIYLQQSKVWNPKKSFCYLNLPKAKKPYINSTAYIVVQVLPLESLHLTVVDSIGPVIITQCTGRELI